MKRTTLRLIPALLIPALLVAGCELAVDFDRTKIPGTATDASTPVVPSDGAVPETDAATESDAGDTDAATEIDAGETDTDAATETDAGESDAATDVDASDAG